ncbi:hypothetical protein KSC_075150 [Ktedonobacter sp. SOSP1-52]|nr:hypothetical protein KSC_075150 [Ktedonobacter sp. SOSP1-52]
MRAFPMPVRYNKACYTLTQTYPISTPHSLQGTYMSEAQKAGNSYGQTAGE